MIDRIGVKNGDGQRHSVEITVQQISAEFGIPSHGYLAECSCYRFVAQAECYDIVLQMTMEHMAGALLVGAE